MQAQWRAHGAVVPPLPVKAQCRNRTTSEIMRDQQSILQQLQGSLWEASSSRMRLLTCAVVGSSAGLLAKDYGAEIDSADAVIRVSAAPVLRFERHVGSQTTVRVWGALLPPLVARSWGQSIT